MKKEKVNIYDYDNEENQGIIDKDEASKDKQENNSTDNIDITEIVDDAEGTESTPKKKGRLKNWIKRHKFLSALIIIIIIVIIIVAAVLIANANRQTTVYSYIRTTTLSKGTLEDSISASGTVSSAETSSVTTNLTYPIKSVNVSVGDNVKAGDVICTLDSTELEKQIAKEEENIEKTISAAQKTYDTSLQNYNDAVSTLDSYESEVNDKEKASDKAYIAYKKADDAISSYQSAYDSALSAYNSAGAAYVKAKSNYETARSQFKNGKISSSNFVSIAKKYMTAVQNYYGGCAVGTYDISDSGSSMTSQSSLSSSSASTGSTNSASSQLSQFDSMSQQGTSSLSSAQSTSSSDSVISTASTASSITVSETANSICDTVKNEVATLTGKSVNYSSGTNTLYKLSQKAENLRDAKIACNYSSLQSEYSTALAQYESAQQMYEQYDNAVDTAKEQLDTAVEQLENAKTSDTLDQLQSSLEDCQLTAGQDGTVISLNATVGSSATGMEAVATIANLDKLKISITIQEADINNATLGLSCNITSDATDDVLSGTLTQVDPVASGNGTFGAEVTLESKNTSLRIGMNASVEIIVSSTEDVYQVPIDAIGNDDDGLGDYVYRQTGGSGTDMTFEKVYVTTGESNDYYIEIESANLNEGDVIRSSSDLTEGIETTESDSASIFDMIGNIGGGRGGDMDNIEGTRGMRGGDSSDFGTSNNNFPGGGFNG